MAAHRAFDAPDSDFASLLNIWRAMPEQPSRNALRRFAKTNYLSQTRLREWRDIHAQLADAVSDDRRAGGNAPPPAASDDAIHRSILAGLLGQIAQRKERNLYQASGNRQVTLFPGSGLCQRQQKRTKAGTADAGTQPPWIVAAEIVQTSQLFARTVARIDPAWVADLGAHLCKFSYADPHWNEKSGRVLAWERVLIFGLEILKRRVDYGKIDPAKATELFIRGALVAREAHIEHRFFRQNQALRERIEAALTRVRDRRVDDLDEAFYRFYAERIANVSSLHDLNRLVRAQAAHAPDFLCAEEQTLLPADDGNGFQYDKTLFPETVSLNNSALPLSYAYAPGEERDGVTVRVPLPVAEGLSGAELQWMVPGMREEQIDTLLRALPKTVRRSLMPLEPKTKEIVRAFQPGRGEFLPALAAFLTANYGVEVRASDWPPTSLPAYLQPRVEVVDRDDKPLVAGRDLRAIQATLEKSDVRSEAWEQAVRRWERPPATGWSFGDVPESVVVEVVGGAPMRAFPGLTVCEGRVSLRLFRKREEAEAASRPGVQRLAEHSLERDLAWVKKELGALLLKTSPTGKPAAQDFRTALDALTTPRPNHAPVPTGGLVDSALRHVATAALMLDPIFPLTTARFQTLLNAARRELPLLARRTGETIVKARTLRGQILASSETIPGFGSGPATSRV